MRTQRHRAQICGVLCALFLLIITGACRPTPPDTTPTPEPTATPTIVPPTPTPAPAERLALAREAARLGELETAEGHYLALQEDPTLADTALWELGVLYEREERFLQASVVFQALLQRHPESPFAPYAHFRLGQRLAALGEYDAAVHHYLAYDAARDAADDAVALALARAYAALGRTEDAIAAYERRYRLADARGDRVQRALTARTLGDIYADLAMWDAAASWYRAALRDSRVPSFRATLIAAIANADLARGRLPLALHWWRTLIAEHGDTPEAFAALQALAEHGHPVAPLDECRVLALNGLWDAAVQTCWALLETDDIAEAHWWAAIAFKNAGNWQQAWREFDKIVQTHPESDLQDDALLEQARVDAAQGDTESAVAAYAQLTTSDSPLAATALWESARLLHSTSPERAATLYEALAQRFPNDTHAADALWSAGMLRYRLGEMSTALADWERLAAYDGWQTQATFWQGKALAAMGDTDAARARWQTTAQSGFDFYVLRARDLLDSPPAPRTTRTLTSFTPAPDTPPPTTAAWERAEELRRLGLSEEARTAYLALFEELAQDAPDSLIAAAATLYAQGEYALSIAAARILMRTHGWTPETAPTDVARLAYPLPFAALLNDASRTYQLDPLLLAAVIYQESRWERRATSSAAARGLMQVIPATREWIAARLGEPTTDRDLYRVPVAVRFGAFYLNYVLQQFDDDVFAALAGYNGGPGNAARWHDPDPDLFVENITFAETRTYVEAVYTHWGAYRAVWGR